MEVFWEYARAFLCGGALCLIGQLLIDKTKLTPARILVLYVVSGVVLGGLGLYKYVVEFGGAGATVPLTGFGYLLAKGAAKAVDEMGILGALTGGVTAAAGGISAAIFFGWLVPRLLNPTPTPVNTGGGASPPASLLRLLFALVQAVRRSTLEQQMRPAITAAAASRRAAGGAHAAYLFQALRHLRRHIRPRLLKYAGHRCP